jgi:hypothetical protein
VTNIGKNIMGVWGRDMYLLQVLRVKAERNDNSERKESHIGNFVFNDGCFLNIFHHAGREENLESS